MQGKINIGRFIKKIQNFSLPILFLGILCVGVECKSPSGKKDMDLYSYITLRISMLGMLTESAKHIDKTNQHGETTILVKELKARFVDGEYSFLASVDSVLIKVINHDSMYLVDLNSPDSTLGIVYKRDIRRALKVDSTIVYPECSYSLMDSLREVKGPEECIKAIYRYGENKFRLQQMVPYSLCK